MEADGTRRQASVRVGMAQMRVIAGQPRQNLQRAVEFIEQASQAGCDLAVLPECLNICADNLPESLAIGEVLACMGAQMLVSPCAWAVPPGHDNALTPYGSLWRGAYGELAQRFGLPVVGVSNVGWVEQGNWAGHAVIGCSLAMAGDGRVLAQGPYGVDAETLLTVELPLRAGLSPVPG